MTSFVSSKLYKDGRVLIKDERSESFIKQVVSVNNQYINFGMYSMIGIFEILSTSSLELRPAMMNGSLFLSEIVVLSFFQ